MHQPHPVRLVIHDDLHRRRLTVFFRLILFIPHAIWLVIWTVGVVFAAIVGWAVALFTGLLPLRLHRFFCSYIRYAAHVSAYINLAANPYPEFNGNRGNYPLDIELPDRITQSRWKIFFRLLLAFPAILLMFAVGSGVTSTSSRTSTSQSKGTTSGSVSLATSGLAGVASVLGWFASVIRGRMPRGLRDVTAYATGYQAQTLAYVLLVTPVYPSTDPAELLSSLDPPPRHPVRIVGDSTDLRRSRTTVLFRLPLAVPHIVWLALWSVLALLVVVVQWFVTLVRGRGVARLHAFLVRYVRYQFQVTAFLYLIANPFPGFAGVPGMYPLELELPGPERQNRWKTAFRLVLAIPVFILVSALSSVLVLAAICSWFSSLARASAPEGLRNLSAYAARYTAQMNAYVLLLTDAYPHASPLEGADPEALEHEGPDLGEPGTAALVAA